MSGKELINVIHRDMLSLCLVLKDEFLQYLDKNLFYLSRQHLSGCILFTYFLQLFIVFQEEAKVLIRNINTQICTIFFLLLFRCFSTAKSMLLNLILDLFCGISHEDSWLWNRGGHLWIKTLQWWEKFVIKTSRLRGFNFWTNISCHSKVRILINTARNQARNIFVSEEMRETRREAWSCLYGWICSLTAAIAEF